MCLPITHRDAGGHNAEVFSLSQTMVAQLTDYRNRPAGEERGFTFEMIERRVLGQLGYAALLVAVVVEAFVRAAVGMLLFGCGCGMLLLTAEVELLIVGVGGVATSGYQVEVGLRCLVALVKNIYRDRMQYEDLRLAFFEIFCD